jgi:hypothetical protein
LPPSLFGDYPPLVASDKLYFFRVWAEKTINETFNDFFNNRVGGV